MTERSRVAGAWLPVVDSLEQAIAHTGDQSDAVVEGVRSILGQALQVLEQLGYPRDAGQGCRSTRSVTRWLVWSSTATAHPGRLSRCCARAGQGSSQLRPAAVVVSRREE